MNSLKNAFKVAMAVLVLTVVSAGAFAPLSLADGACASCGKAGCEGKCSCSGGSNCGSCKGA